MALTLMIIMRKVGSRSGPRAYFVLDHREQLVRAVGSGPERVGESGDHRHDADQDEGGQEASP
jgi:hypothetical protein